MHYIMIYQAVRQMVPQGATPWCNGSTTGFGPVSLGSNPGGVAIFGINSGPAAFPAVPQLNTGERADETVGRIQD